MKTEKTGKCVVCTDKKAFRDTNFCRSCTKKIVHDAELLLRNSATINHAKLGKWLRTYERTNHFLFIGGRFNEHPERLLMNENVLSTVDLKTFWERFKYHKNLYM